MVDIAAGSEAELNSNNDNKCLKKNKYKSNEVFCYIVTCLKHLFCFLFCKGNFTLGQHENYTIT